MTFVLRSTTLMLAALAAAGCSDGMSPGTVSLTAVSPAPQASSVSAGTTIVLTFSARMMPAMAQYVDLHQGGVSGPVVPMTCAWNGDETTLTCTPQGPLAPGTQYTTHVGAGMTDDQGHMIEMDGWTGMGGQWATTGMMGGGHDGQPLDMMGSGWMHGPHYGMLFQFTTA